MSMVKRMLHWLSRPLRKARDVDSREHASFQDLNERAERVARLAGYMHAADAFRALEAGELAGTLLERELRSILFLAHGERFVKE